MGTQDISVNFEHWTCALNSAELRKWGSPHFDRKTVGEAIGRIFRSRGARSGRGPLTISRDLVAVCNHAYPEAAIVDPLADVELWEEWRLGVREFPYLGRFAPLGIFQQGGKTSSTSSIGVLGEALAGRFAESMIGPTVLVRVVRHWPDFILHAPGTPGRFAFVESKAVGPDGALRLSECGGRVPGTQFSELAEQVVRQLNADPFVDIWGAFTVIRSISPHLDIDFTFVQFSAADDKKSEARRAGIPAPVLSGLAERSVGAAVVTLGEEERVEFLGTPRNRKYRKETESRLYSFARVEFQSIVSRELGQPSGAEEDVSAYLEQAISRLVSDTYLPGQRTREARTSSQSSGQLVVVGNVGGQQILMADLPVSDGDRLRKEWKPELNAAVKPWDVQHDVVLWRAGGAVFAIGNADRGGTPVRPRGI
jgi:hypothetical protein